LGGVAPLIGISSWRQLVEEDGQDVASLVSHASYARAVEKAGGLTVVLPEAGVDNVDALLDRVDGVVLVGGPDVGPSRYGAPVVDARTSPAAEGRDLFDIALAQRCVARNQPLLAICRGIQVLNVALGGTLVQHLDDHMVTDKWNESVHTVKIEPASRLAGVVGTTDLEVNSLHHQALDAVGDGASVVAWAHDGTPEAIEVADAANVLGIQWHAELLRHRPEHLALFEDLVRRASAAR
jgi:putative glutamine amidotransferase